MARMYWNIMDENYWIEDDDGIVVGIGKTTEEAIRNAQELNFDCRDLEFFPKPL